jgi:chemotaxis response regulator CheB
MPGLLHDFARALPVALTHAFRLPRSPNLPKFFAKRPQSGMAFVLVQHLDPQPASMPVELLSAKTKMPVMAATDGTPVTANSLFVIPPNAVLTISEGVLRLSRPAGG